jgi:hypothetical protein
MADTVMAQHVLSAQGFSCVCSAKKTNDLATFVEARLGKPSHLLEGDKLKQFLAQVRNALLVSAQTAALCGWQFVQNSGPAAVRLVLCCKCSA